MSHLTVVDHPLVQHKLSLLRQKDTPTVQFRALVGEIGQLLTFEATRDMPVVKKPIETPIQLTEAPLLSGRKPSLISILRAGNGMLDGFLSILPTARVGFVGLYRNEETLEPVEYYFKAPPNLSERTVFVVDPMLATGNSAVAAIDLLKREGAKDLKFICLLSAPEGVQRMASAHPDVPVITAAVDEMLNSNGYIVPGLGDAGDRIFGTR